jgi:glutaminyl-peptide cyclotransferase
MTPALPRAAIGFALALTALSSAAAAPVYGYRVVREYPHDRNAFTQGLVWADGALYEGTGLHGRSSIRKVRLETGQVLRTRDLPAEHFGEGIAVWRDRLLQLTWESRTGFIYDRASFRPDRPVQLPGRGLGPDARRPAADHERRHARAALPGPPTPWSRPGGSR